MGEHRSIDRICYTPGEVVEQVAADVYIGVGAGAAEGRLILQAGDVRYDLSALVDALDHEIVKYRAQHPPIPVDRLKKGDWTRNLAGSVPGHAWVVIDTVPEGPDPDGWAVVWVCLAGPERGQFANTTQESARSLIEQGAPPSPPVFDPSRLSAYCDGVAVYLRDQQRRAGKRA